MKITIGLALASGLFLMVAGCSTGGGATGTAAPSGGAAATTTGGGAAGAPAVASAGGDIRNFNLEVKCPGVHYLKSHGKSDMDIMQQLQVDQGNIADCEAWAASQPKGYVPPPPPGTAPASGAAAGGPGASSSAK